MLGRPNYFNEELLEQKVHPIFCFNLFLQPLDLLLMTNICLPDKFVCGYKHVIMYFEYPIKWACFLSHISSRSSLSVVNSSEDPISDLESSLCSLSISSPLGL